MRCSIAPATTAAAAAATSTTAATRAIFSWAGFIDSQCSTVVFLGIEGINGGLSFGIASHFNEPEAFAAAAVAIRNDLGTIHRSELRKHVFEV